MITLWQSVFGIMVSLLVFTTVSLIIIKLWFYGIFPLLSYLFEDFFEDGNKDKDKGGEKDRQKYIMLRNEFFEHSGILPPDVEIAIVAFIICLVASFFWPLLLIAGVCYLIHSKVEGRKKQLQSMKTQEERIKALEDLLSKATRHE